MDVGQRRSLAKSGRIQAVAYQSSQPGDLCADSITATIDLIEGAQTSGRSVQLHGFGRLYPVAVRTSTSLDPTRKVYVERPSRLQVGFQPGRWLTPLSAEAEMNQMNALARGVGSNG